MKGFKEWLQERLADTSRLTENYNPEGNSPRARAARGLFGEIVWQTKKWPRSYINHFKYDYAGFDTPIATPIVTVIITVLFPIMPVLRGYFSYRRAIREYRLEYNRILPK